MTTPRYGSFSRAQTTYPGGTPRPTGLHRHAASRLSTRSYHPGLLDWFNNVWSGATATVDLGGGPITATYIAKDRCTQRKSRVAVRARDIAGSTVNYGKLGGTSTPDHRRLLDWYGATSIQTRLSRPAPNDHATNGIFVVRYMPG